MPRPEVEAVIDTGSADCVVSASLAALLGLQSAGRAEFALADGQIAEFPIAGLGVELEGRVAFVTAAIVPDPAEPILGANALAALGLGVEPRTEKPIPEVILLLSS